MSQSLVLSTRGWGAAATVQELCVQLRSACSGGWGWPPPSDTSPVHMPYPGSQVANDPSLVLVIKALGGVGAGCEGPQGMINPQEGRGACRLQTGS